MSELRDNVRDEIAGIYESALRDGYVSEDDICDELGDWFDDAGTAPTGGYLAVDLPAVAVVALLPGQCNSLRCGIADVFDGIAVLPHRC